MIKKLMNQYGRLPVQAKASLWFFICSFLEKGIATITTPVFTRILTASEYGQFNTYRSWSGIISVIVSMNLSYGVLTRGIIKNEGKKEGFISSLLGLSTVLIAVWFVIYLTARDFWNQLFSLPTAQMIAMFASIWASVVFLFWSTGERIDYRYKKMVALTLMMSITRPVLEYIIITHTENRVTNRIIGDAVLTTVVYFFLFILLFRRGKLFYNGSYWKYAFLFNLPLIPHYLSQVILNSSDRIMISNMVGSREAGIYNLAYTLSTIFLMLNHSINSTMEPWLYRKIRDGKAEELSEVVYPLFAFTAALNLLLIIFGPEIIAIFAPQEYYDAIWIIPPVALSVYFQFTYVSFAVFEFYYKKPHYVSLSTISGGLANVVLNYIFIKKFGYYAAGYTTLACYMIFSAMHYMFMKMIVRKNLGSIVVYPFRKFACITGIFLTAGFGILSTYRNPLLRYAAIIILLVPVVILRKRLLRIGRKILYARNSVKEGGQQGENGRHENDNSKNQNEHTPDH